MITPAQSRAARALINWSQPQLSTAAGVSVSTVRDFETGKRTPIANNLAAIRTALEAAGVVFIDNDGLSGAAVRLAPRQFPEEQAEYDPLSYLDEP